MLPGELLVDLEADGLLEEEDLDLDGQLGGALDEVRVGVVGDQQRQIDGHGDDAEDVEVAMDAQVPAEQHLVGGQLEEDAAHDRRLAPGDAGEVDGDGGAELEGAAHDLQPGRRQLDEEVAAAGER